MKLTLFLDDKSSKLLFAEADKGFVDFLFTILSLPLGTIARLLMQEDDMLGSLGALYKGIESLSYSYIEPDVSKEDVLCPKVTRPFDDYHVPLLGRVGSSSTDKSYRCESCNSKYVATRFAEKCRPCGNDMYMEVEYLNPPLEGYVYHAVTYMVMDDLDIKPMSGGAIAVMSLLKPFNIKDVGDLKQKTVSLGKAEGLQLLRASLVSKTVLTDVFLSKAEVKEE
ncbi:unnamed protein product [Rhodiola kirilowii]